MPESKSELTLSPKKLLTRLSPEALDEIRVATRSSTLISAINTTLAEMAWSGCPQEQLAGATRFARELVDITVESKTSKPLPIKSLKGS